MNPAIITAAIAVLAESIKLVNQVREDLRQSAEWTPEQEAEFDAKVASLTSAPHWQPEKK